MTIESSFEQITERLDIEWLILCDAAQVIGGKLYLLGGGWDTIFVNSIGESKSITLAAAIRVPWNETNTRHNLEFLFLTEDGTEMARMTGQFESGRPAGMPPGANQLAQVVLRIDAKFPAIGRYVVRGHLNGELRRAITFNVAPGPQFQREKKQP